MLEKLLEEVNTALKLMYLEVANNYDVSDLHTDSDRVACVASRCRSVAGELIREIFHKHINDGWIPVEDEKKPGEYETVLCVTGKSYYFVAVYNSKYGFRTEDVGAEEAVAWRRLPVYMKPEEND